MDPRTDISNYLDKLRAKPEHVRNRIAVLLSSFVFVLVFSGWIMSKQSPSVDQSEALSRASSPLLVVANTFSGLKTETKDAISSFQQNLTEVQQESATSTAQDVFESFATTTEASEFESVLLPPVASSSSGEPSREQVPTPSEGSTFSSASNQYQ